MRQFFVAISVPFEPHQNDLQLSRLGTGVNAVNNSVNQTKVATRKICIPIPAALTNACSPCILLTVSV